MRFMKSLFLVVLFFMSTVAFSQIHKMAPKVVLIGIGEKNQTLDESLYPNIEFYYTPNLQSKAKANSTVKAFASMSGAAKETFEGQPEFLAELWNEKDLKEAFMLFDKEGVCATQGYHILQQGSDIGNRLCADKDKLEKHLKTYVKKEKTAKPAKRDMKLKKSDFMVGREMPEFNVVSVSGEEKSINSIIDGQPTLIVFFQLSKDIDIAEGKKADQSDKSGKQLFATMTQAAAGSDIENLFVQLESQFFNYDARQ